MVRTLVRIVALVLFAVCALVGCSGDDSTSPDVDPNGLKLIKHAVTTEDACGTVNIMFQVLTMNGVGKGEKFLANVRKAVSHGLDAELPWKR